MSRPAAREPGAGRLWRRLALSGGTALAALIGLAIYVSVVVGDLGLSTNGYIALALGAVGTALVTAGLMSLVFFSNRRGYDDEAGKLPGDSRTGR